jgi:hypothetical protein
MDIQFFLFQRLGFIEQFYKNSAASFVERKRRIEAEEEPFVPPYSEDDEPPFLVEWIEADESLNVLGRSCISMLAASFHLYLKTWEHQIGIPIDESLKLCFKKNGWFHGYKAYFAERLGVRFEDSQCDLSLLEELVLARNRVQHPESITNHSTHYSDSDLKKLPRPFFVDEKEFDLFADVDEGARSWLTPPTVHVTAEKLLSALSEVARFSKWLEDLDFDPRRSSPNLARQASS